MSPTYVAHCGPLKREIRDFSEAIDNKRDPLVTVIDGLKDLEIAKAAEGFVFDLKKVILN